MDEQTSASWSDREWLTFESLFEDAITGIASADDLERLDRYLRSNQTLQYWTVERLQDECLIREEMCLLEAVSKLNDSSLVAALQADQVACSRRPEVFRVGRERLAGSWPIIATVATTLLICSLALNISHWKRAEKHQLAGAEPLGESVPVPVTARLVRETGCSWYSTDGQTISLGDSLLGGKSLELLEGIAEVHFQQEFASGLVRVQGPGAIVSRADGVPILRHGKMTFDINLHGKSFSIETPFGHVELNRSGSFGLFAVDGQMQLHVFDGELTVYSVWLDDRTDLPSKFESGEAVVFEKKEDTYQSERVLADAQLFASELSMLSDRLYADEQYAKVIVASKPSNYWRFNDAPGTLLASGPERTLKNEIDGGLPLHVTGSVATVRLPDNRALEFGMTPDSGYLHSNGNWSNEDVEDYSIEFWIKPSHFHNGALLSLIDARHPDSHRGIHGLLLEIGGPHNLVARRTLPNSIRFMGRSFSVLGDAAMAELSVADGYDVRKWMHVVAVGRSKGMQLFVNGKLMTENRESRPQPRSQKLIIGQVYFDRAERRFIGQFDELATYFHALTAEEILRHYRLGTTPAYRPHTNRPKYPPASTYSSKPRFGNWYESAAANRSPVF